MRSESIVGTKYCAPGHCCFDGPYRCVCTEGQKGQNKRSLRYTLRTWQRPAADNNNPRHFNISNKLPPHIVSPPFPRADFYPACSGLEVVETKGSPAISDGFTASLVAPPGTYMKDDHKGKPGMAPWISFMARLTNDGFKFESRDGYLPMFEVYSGQGGEENVTMYTAVVSPAK